MSKQSPTITVDEWLAELDRLNKPSNEGFTTRELGEAWGTRERVTRERLRQLQSAGLLKVVTKQALMISGGLRPVPAYVLLRRKK